MISEDIQKCQNILLFAFLILHSYISGVTKFLARVVSLEEGAHWPLYGVH